ncbi:hypothetical protein BS47DRAFT_469959 [Hydnum rufescens UP504]|uniref:URB1 N-terminal domain-containing protein n=1 Tax=Hydnum rufescens UP504 TaxID=1448309 RepID=A0A9P6E040_9AGAM|nr:hypothetical protein BS47DRAFT_469959 [Hydnum rufescens UP504]
MYMRRLNAHLGGAQHDLILMTLKLFNAMVGFADGREKRAIMDGFAWGMKSLPKLLAMRRRAPSGGKQDSFAKADIRTLFITFILSFVSPTTPVR